MKNIYLESEEEIISIVDKLIQSKDNHINLFIPSGAQIWQSSINLKLLKRESDNLKKKVVLIVSDDLGAEMAEKIGFEVRKEDDFPVEMVKEEEKLEEEEAPTLIEDEVGIPTPKDVGKAPEQQEEDSKDMIDFLVDELKPEEKTSSVSLVSSVNEPRKKMADIVNPANNVQHKFFDRRFFKKKPTRKIVKIKPKKEQIKTEQKTKQDIFVTREYGRIKERISLESPKWPRFLIIFVFTAFFTAALIGYLVLPTVKITIHPKSEKTNFDISVIGSKNISQVDLGLNEIPIQEIEVNKTKSKEFISTGEKQLNEKAKGFITIYNEYSSSPQVLVAVTRFESPEGKIFRISENITVPGAKIQEGKIVASSINVEVTADEPGDSYNIGSSNFTIPGFKGTAKYAGFYAKSTSPMTGGSTEKVKIISADDIKNAEESLAEEIKEEVRQAFEEQIPTELKIIESSLEEDIITVSTVKEGVKTDKFNIEMKMVIRALLFKEEDVNSLVDLNIVSIISEDKEPISETQKIQWGDPVFDKEKGEVFIDLNVEEDIAWKIDTESLKNDLVGLDEVAVRKYLSNKNEIEKSEVSFWPFWVKHIPKQEKRIKIIVDPS